jgi:hypothetical protein
MSAPVTVPLGKHTDIQVVTPAIFSDKHIRYLDITQNSMGGKEAYLRYAERPFYFQTPRLHCPFGLNVTENPERDGRPASKSYRLAVSFRGYNDPQDKSFEKKREFHDMITQIDEALVKKGCENCLTLFKRKTMTEDMVRMIYKTSIRKNDEGKYPPIMNLNIVSYDGKMTTDVFDKDGKQISYEELEDAITKGCEVKCLVQAQKLTFPQGGFGIKYNILNMKVWSAKNGLKGKGCMIDDSDTDE